MLWFWYLKRISVRVFIKYVFINKEKSVSFCWDFGDFCFKFDFFVECIVIYVFILEIGLSIKELSLIFLCKFLCNYFEIKFFGFI